MSEEIFGDGKMEIHNNKTKFNGNWVLRCLSRLEDSTERGERYRLSVVSESKR